MTLDRLAGLGATAWEWLQREGVISWLYAALLLALGWGFARFARELARRLAGDRLSAQHAMIVQRLAWWAVFGLAVTSALRQLGFDLSVLLGAAGILTVAVGFASQTSASNLISGLFLLGERPFVVGDLVQIGATTGEVVSIDLLSVKLRTFDNLLVRVPNESLLKTEIVNLTHFPIRRIDLRVVVGYDEDLARVRRALLALADRHPRVLDEPRPVVWFRDFGEIGIGLQFSAWTSREGFFEARNQLAEELKVAFDREGIRFPVAWRALGEPEPPPPRPAVR